MPPDGEEVKIKRYVVYELKVRQDTRNAMDPQPATIERRYTDFRDMYQSLKRDHPQEMSNIDFPNKVEILLHLLHKKIVQENIHRSRSNGMFLILVVFSIHFSIDNIKYSTFLVSQKNTESKSCLDDIDIRAENLTFT